MHYCCLLYCCVYSACKSPVYNELMTFMYNILVFSVSIGNSLNYLWCVMHSVHIIIAVYVHYKASTRLLLQNNLTKREVFTITHTNKNEVP